MLLELEVQVQVQVQQRHAECHQGLRLKVFNIHSSFSKPPNKRRNQNSNLLRVRNCGRTAGLRDWRFPTASRIAPEMASRGSPVQRQASPLKERLAAALQPGGEQVGQVWMMEWAWGWEFAREGGTSTIVCHFFFSLTQGPQGPGEAACITNTCEKLE